MTSLRPHFRRELKLAKKAARSQKLNAEQTAALIARAYARHEERKLLR
jgi:hypothetical protein